MTTSLRSGKTNIELQRIYRLSRQPGPEQAEPLPRATGCKEWSKAAVTLPKLRCKTIRNISF